ncbi:MAG: gamma-glutamyl-gamma-aminobutyrate hydrolase family protein [Limisphaerales bacterium]
MDRPLILVSPSTESKGAEFGDSSISLSNRYFNAILKGGGMPLCMPLLDSPELVAEYVSRCDGVLLTGGGDVQTQIYAPDLSASLARKAIEQEPERDVLELLLIKEVFRQGKPLLAICRGHQILNVALGGTLIVDIPTEVPNALDHRRMDRKNEPVHSVQLTEDSDLSKCFNSRRLEVNSTHHQAVGQVADALQVVARSDDGIIEGMELKDRTMLPFLISVQFHPERLIDENKKFVNLFRYLVSACVAGSQKKI